MKPSARRAFALLLGAFGRQGWWPLTPPGGDRPVYEAGRPFPRLERERFEVAVGAILTQNAAWTNVERALSNLHRVRAMEAGRLARVGLSTLAAWVRPSGYFRQKAVKLRRFARWVGSNGGRLGPKLAGPLEQRRAVLLSLYGVGPETADSILLYAGGRPAFVVDAYTRRIGSRLGWFDADEDHERIRSFFETVLPRRPSVYAELHALLVALAKHFCRTEPLCAACPLSPMCPSAARARLAGVCRSGHRSSSRRA